MKDRLVIAAAQLASIPGDLEANLARHERFVLAAADRGARLIVFPELSLSGYEPSLAKECVLGLDDERLHPLRELAAAREIAVVAGAPFRAPDGGLHIGAILIEPGKNVAGYAKQHLHGNEKDFFVPGHLDLLFTIPGASVALAVCADTSHPEHAESAARRGATLYAAGVLWTEKGYGSDAALLQDYARRHSMAVLMANHAAPSGGWVPAGRSAVWAENGSLVAAAPGDGELLVLAEREEGGWRGEVVYLPPAATL